MPYSASDISTQSAKPVNFRQPWTVAQSLVVLCGGPRPRCAASHAEFGPSVVNHREMSDRKGTSRRESTGPVNNVWVRSAQCSCASRDVAKTTLQRPGGLPCPQQEAGTQRSVTPRGLGITPICEGCTLRRSKSVKPAAGSAHPDVTPQRSDSRGLPSQYRELPTTGKLPVTRYRRLQFITPVCPADQKYSLAPSWIIRAGLALRTYPKFAGSA